VHLNYIISALCFRVNKLLLALILWMIIISLMQAFW